MWRLGLNLSLGSLCRHHGGSASLSLSLSLSSHTHTITHFSPAGDSSIAPCRPAGWQNFKRAWRFKDRNPWGGIPPAWREKRGSLLSLSLSLSIPVFLSLFFSIPVFLSPYLSFLYLRLSAWMPACLYLSVLMLSLPILPSASFSPFLTPSISRHISLTPSFIPVLTE